MRAPIEWLREHCRPELDAHALAERLAMTGTEVERVLTHGVGALEHFVVGRVLEAHRHPDADRLTVCRVDVGSGEVAEIVCGAPNVTAGQTVAVGRPGAVMPDGTQLKAAKLRGVVSHGMILAEDELAIGPDHDGIMVLDGDLVPGSPLQDVLPIATDVLELEITPNRPDCLGVYGVAREVHAATGAALGPAPWEEDLGTAGPVAGASVEVQAPDLCPRFTARAFENVRIGPSPPWLKARLTAAGQRPISNVVDITNYVMLLTGQPLHAFDLDRVAGGKLVVRRAREGENVETLDGVVRRLDAEMVVIDDAQGPTSIAGVMGGARSEVEPGTTRVLMEAATWIGPNVNRTSARLGLRSEASARFEKQLQPEQAMEAQIVATRLMLEVCGATVNEGTVDVAAPAPASPAIRLRDERIERLLGVAIPRARAAEILTALGFGVGDAPDGLDVAVPSFRRADVTREADLIEEIARLHGLEKLPTTLPSRRRTAGRLTRRQLLRRRASDALVDRGLGEIVGWSFADPSLGERLRLPAEDPRRDAVRLANPMAEDQSELRTTLLGSLLDAARRNAARSAENVRLFEDGAVYRAASAGGELPRESHHLGALVTGSARAATWRDPEPPPVDFFAAKGVLAAVLDTLRAPWTVELAAEPFLHPGAAAAVHIDGEVAGWLGELHPLVLEQWDVPRAAGFELDLDVATDAAVALPLHEDLTSFPELHQDLAVVVDDGVPAARALETVRRAGAPVLASAEIFDVYRGEQTGEGRVSLALRLAFRAPDRTLTDDDVAGPRERIVAALRDELGAELRA
ncbi:MAG: phenylalanyl-tRNA synthetase beta chain [Solirubrobacteraceae bacterium]|nr:phenylalanyl-tRNA synthetase beta chain [Solirubrobacteraceae bacterium]